MQHLGRGSNFEEWSQVTSGKKYQRPENEKGEQIYKSPANAIEKTILLMSKSLNMLYWHYASGSLHPMANHVLYVLEKQL